MQLFEKVKMSLRTFSIYNRIGKISKLNKRHLRSPQFLLLGCFSFFVCHGVASSKAQAFETFYVKEGMALNTNMNFRLFDTKPRMSIFQRNDNDPDQQFERFSGNRGGILLRNRSTGMCLNAHYLYNGAEMNTWPCDANDVDQNWNLVLINDGWHLIQRSGTNLCVDTPTRDNAGKVHLWACDPNNPNQRWKSSAWNSTPVPPPPVGEPLSQYEVWIVARKPDGRRFNPDFGHAWIAIVKRDDRGDLKTYKTFGFWASSVFRAIGGEKREPSVNNKYDVEDTNTLLNGGLISKTGFAVRKSRISESRAKWIEDGAYREAGCSYYIIAGGFGIECNCADYATREWHVLSSKWEDFRIRHTPFKIFVDDLVDAINKKNKETGSDYLDGGKTWQ